MPAEICLANGHSVETLLFNSVCKMLKRIASLYKNSSKKSERADIVWVGLIAIRELYLKSSYQNYEMGFESSAILSSFELCNNDGGLTENIRNIVLSLINTKDGEIYMTIPVLMNGDDPIFAEEKLDLGFVPNFPPNKNPR
jgi:hypothetical protein